MRRGDRLHVVVADREEAAEGRGEQVRGLLRHDHGAALAHAENLFRVQQHVGRAADGLGADELLRLRERLDRGGAELAAHVGDRVLRRDLARDRRGQPLVHDRGLGDGQLERVVAAVADLPAEARDRRVRHAAVPGQLRNREVLHLLALHRDVVRDLLLRRGQLIVAVADLHKYVAVWHNCRLSRTRLSDVI